MSIDRATVRKVARLARIAVREDEEEQLAGELSGVLDWIEELQAVDVEGVEPMASVHPLDLPRRADTLTAAEGEAGIQDKVLANAPDARQGFYAVPKVVE
ncbi:MAG: Asp-tRNA(Asn)/Glu-tRNA(Gln) amidotransferase subunit GatC [Pseudomonadota bacterium]